jgi:hypothetical protein
MGFGEYMLEWLASADSISLQLRRVKDAVSRVLSADVSSLQVHGGVLIMAMLYDTGCITRTAVGLPFVLRVPRGGARGRPIVRILSNAIKSTCFRSVKGVSMH